MHVGNTSLSTYITNFATVQFFSDHLFLSSFHYGFSLLATFDFTILRGSVRKSMHVIVRMRRRMSDSGNNRSASVLRIGKQFD